MPREIEWLVQRIEERDPVTLEVIRYGKERNVPRAKVMEDNFSTPGIWKVLDQNPGGVNDPIYEAHKQAKSVASAQGQTNAPPDGWQVTKRHTPTPMAPNK